MPYSNPEDLTHDEILATELMVQVAKGNKRRIEDLLAAGASLRGCPRVCIPPLVTCAGEDNLEMVEFLIAKGADVNAPSPLDPLTDWRAKRVAAGSRALHHAALSGGIDVIRLLLRAGADPLLKDEDGRSAIFMACVRQKAGDEVEIMSTLLKAGADAGVADINGFAPLHFAAIRGRDKLVGILLSEAPGLLNRAPRGSCERGVTPLYFTAEAGHASTVSLLLAAGARQTRPSVEGEHCPLAIAVQKGHADVVRLLIDKGIEAIGGMSMVLPKALGCAIRKGQSDILGMILKAGGEKLMRDSERCSHSGRRTPLLHLAVGFAILRSVTALLAVGADEREVGLEGCLARDIVGSLSDPDIEERPRHPAVVPAILRALERGPAFRARSWTWPSLRAAGDAGAGDDGAATVPKASKPSPARRLTSDVRLFRPRDRSSIVRLFSRYVNKN